MASSQAELDHSDDLVHLWNTQCENDLNKVEQSCTKMEEPDDFTIADDWVDEWSSSDEAACVATEQAAAITANEQAAAITANEQAAAITANEQAAAITAHEQAAAVTANRQAAASAANEPAAAAMASTASSSEQTTTLSLSSAWFPPAPLSKRILAPDSSPPPAPTLTPRQAHFVATPLPLASSTQPLIEATPSPLDHSLVANATGSQSDSSSSSESPESVIFFLEYQVLTTTLPENSGFVQYPKQPEHTLLVHRSPLTNGYHCARCCGDTIPRTVYFATLIKLREHALECHAFREGLPSDWALRRTRSRIIPALHELGLTFRNGGIHCAICKYEITNFAHHWTDNFCFGGTIPETIELARLAVAAYVFLYCQ